MTDATRSIWQEPAPGAGPQAEHTPGPPWQARAPLRARLAAGARPLCLALLLVSAPQRLGAQTIAADIPAIPPGSLTAAPSGHGLAEELDLPRTVVAALRTLAPEGRARLLGWPVAPGERRAAVVARFDVYAPAARLFVVGPRGPVETPRSRWRFFSGRAENGAQVLIRLDPDRDELAGLSAGEEGTWELGVAPESGSDAYFLAAPGALAKDARGAAPSWDCGQEALPETPAIPVGPRPGAVVAGGEKAITTLHTATIAVDTDNELLNRKFGNNTTNATNYVASLIAAMSVFYERDLLVRLLQGTTFLRPSTTADPYVQPCGAGTTDCQTTEGAGGPALDEFSTYWSGGCGGSCVGVQRALTMMLSGKQSNAYSASGIAWVDSLCSTGSGYSFSQVFKFPLATAADDANLVGHELGHNFGSPHTHNPAGYNPPIDTCATTNNPALFDCVIQCGAQCPLRTTDGALACNACPAAATYSGLPNVRGTIMSYCHMLSGCSNTSVFHPRTLDLLDPIVQARVGTCIFPAAQPPLFADGFEGGRAVPAWSGKSP